MNYAMARQREFVLLNGLNYDKHDITQRIYKKDNPLCNSGYDAGHIVGFSPNKRH